MRACVCECMCAVVYLSGKGGEKREIQNGHFTFLIKLTTMLNMNNKQTIDNGKLLG